MKIFPPANGTETIAEAQGNGTYKLSGYKWFSSATDADMTLTLARICDSHGNTVPVSSRHFVWAMYYPSGFVFTLAMPYFCNLALSTLCDKRITTGLYQRR